MTPPEKKKCFTLDLSHLERELRIEDVYMSVAGHLCNLNTLILKDCGVWESGFLLAHGDG